MVPVQSVMAPSDLAGSKQYILSQFLGSYCLIDSLIGTGTLMRKEGYLYEVGVSYIVLFSDGVYTCLLYTSSLTNTAMARMEKVPMEETPTARPSSPSIKLTALVMPTIQTMVRGMESTPRLI